MELRAIANRFGFQNSNKISEIMLTKLHSAIELRKQNFQIELKTNFKFELKKSKV